MRVVARDADLAGHVERDFLQAVLVGNLVDEGDDEFEAGCEGARVLAQALLHPGVLLGDDLDRLRDEDGCDDEENDGKFHEPCP
ncbi:hypothetical protein SDC9_197154 [bioreactor metagenome]|uniref:Uncharacterized protein n=1 Tax=bioreactor metagenome TaxID=1076179 RepID=A0A645IQJ0_9ZZZZ